MISQGRLLTEATVAQLRGGSSLVVRAEPLEVALPAVRGLVGARSALLTGSGIRIESDIRKPLVRIARQRFSPA
ncbi:hypothetical protein [Nocardia abscessus]|uniref:Uncharacterized protein n=1 Tax=Nocardia abscessus TaxID=120957 RepID=A0ABS0CHP5_9NOCA|nr:hypothetical protein [Nocardia abscessus]MBF6229023.1 hypothetical protein [Nocardia abscessus]